jgi:hypothetical protein
MIVGEWLYYESARRGSKYHGFKADEARSICGFAERDVDRAKRPAQIAKPCQQCGSFLRGKGVAVGAKIATPHRFVMTKEIV